MNYKFKIEFDPVRPDFLSSTSPRVPAAVHFTPALQKLPTLVAPHADNPLLFHGLRVGDEARLLPREPGSRGRPAGLSQNLKALPGAREQP